MEQLLFMAADTLPLSHHLSSVMSPIQAVASPPVKSRSSRTAAARRSLLKIRRRTKRRSPPPSGGEDDGFFSGSGDGDDGGFGGGGGRGWNFDGFGGGFHDWNGDDHSSSGPDDPAFDFVYEVVCWIVFSNCLHFAFKRAMTLVVSEEREKVVPMRLASVC